MSLDCVEIVDNCYPRPEGLLGRCAAAVPPGATLKKIEIRLRCGEFFAVVSYLYHGLRLPNRIEVTL